MTKNKFLQGALNQMAEIDPLLKLPLSSVIAECAARGVVINLIMAGITERYGIPHGDAKRLVMRHPVWGKNQQQEWDRFHDEIERVLLPEKNDESNRQ